MTTRKLIRWSGLSLMLGGVGYAVRAIMHPPGETAQYTFDPLWVPSHVIGGIALILIALGLVGLYVRQLDKVGLPGLIAFIVTFIGCTLTTGSLIFLSVVVNPFVAAQGLDWMDPPNGALFTSTAGQLAVGVGALCLLLGLLLFAITTLRARVLPPWGAWLIILTIPLGILGVVFIFFIGTSSLQGVLQSLLGSMLGLGLALWGYALWSDKDAMVMESKAAM